jgi:hypothetical protein
MLAFQLFIDPPLDPAHEEAAEALRGSRNEDATSRRRFRSCARRSR